MNKQGSVLGGTLLITGSCVGAGLLGLPILTGMEGFVSSSIMLFLAWLFMTITAFLMVEVLGWFKKSVNLISMVEHTLGPIGRTLCWFLYLFLFYALLVAYMSLSGNHTAAFSKHALDFDLPDWVGTSFFVIFFGWLIYFGTKPVDHLNRVLMFGKIVIFGVLILFGLQFVKGHLLTHFAPEYAFFSFPILIISFGFHNMIPSLMRYMGGDRKRVRQAILAGSLFALAIYLIWEVLVLGILPQSTIMESYHQDIDGAEAIRHYLGSSLIGYSAQILAFFAILTSFLAQSLSLVHFLRDGLKLHKRKREHVGMCLLALCPPLLFSLLFPQLFFKALNFAGGICAVVLFGVFPALMVWIGRYKKNQLIKDRLLGGRILLLLVLLTAALIFFCQLTQLFGLDLFPKP